MSVPLAILAGIAMGLVFGIALQKARVCEPGVVVCQMQLARHTMLKMFLSAVATGLVVLAALTAFGLTPLHPKATLFAANVIGGSLLGIGITLAGACPGTVLAQIGVGYRDAIVTFIGGLFGALAFTYAEPGLKPTLLSGGPGKLTLDQVLGVPYPALALGFAAAIVLFLVWLERIRPWRGEMKAAADPEPAPPPAAAQHSPA